jgi:hypothetical protein
MAVGAAIFMAIFVTRPGCAQDPAKKESKKVIKINVVTENNGKTTVIDTTMVLPDSAMTDSLREEIDRVIELGEGGGHARLRYHNMPQAYEYKFEMPDMPEELMELEHLGGMGDCDWEGFAGSPDCRMMKIGGNRGQSLNDLLGDIPMDRVTSYSIKDTKKGKRIVIELENGPIIEREQKIIVIREPGRPAPKHRMKVIRHMDEDSVMPEPSSPETPPPPPPPPPPDKKQEKSKTGAPKI